MSGQGQTVELDVSSALQEGTHEFTRLYEENAYRVYNLALRVTGDAESASDVAERAFLGAGLADDSEGRLLALTLEHAMASASGDRDAHGVGAAEPGSLLHITAGMSSAARAILALGEICELDTAAIALRLGLNERMVVRLRERALEELAVALDTGPELADGLYRNWLWTMPPDDLWEAIFASFYPLLEKEVRRGRDDPRHSGVASARRLEHRWLTPWMGRLGRHIRAVPVWLSLGVLLLAALGAAGAARYGVPLGGDGEEGAVTPAPPRGPSGGSGFSEGLTPERLDELRQRELSRLRRYGREQLRQDREGRVSRKAATERKERLERRRRAKQKREEARRREARRRERTRTEERRTAPAPQQPREQPAPQEPTDQQPPRQEAPPEENRDDDGPPTPDEAEEECLFNPDTGTYVCPQ